MDQQLWAYHLWGPFFPQSDDFIQNWKGHHFLLVYFPGSWPYWLPNLIHSISLAQSLATLQGNDQLTHLETIGSPRGTGMTSYLCIFGSHRSV